MKFGALDFHPANEFANKTGRPVQLAVKKNSLTNNMLQEPIQAFPTQQHSVKRIG